MKASKLLIAGGLALLLCLSGCGLVDNLQTFKENDGAADQDSEQPQVIVDDDLQSDAQDEDTMTAPLPGRGQSGQQDAADSAPDAAADNSETHQVTLYFANEEGRLEAEQRMIPKQEGLARATVNQLISGPHDESLLPTLPAATILEDINISGGICTVDFSSELLSDLPDDQQKQKLALYSIVNTLTQFDSVDEVRLLVNGQALDSFGGVDVSAAVAPQTW